MGSLGDDVKHTTPIKSLYTIHEVVRLKELNRELHAELKDLCDHITQPCPVGVSYPASLRDINGYHRARISKDKISKARDLLAGTKKEGI